MEGELLLNKRELLLLHFRFIRQLGGREVGFESREEFGAIQDSRIKLDEEVCKPVLKLFQARILYNIADNNIYKLLLRCINAIAIQEEKHHASGYSCSLVRIGEAVVISYARD